MVALEPAIICLRIPLVSAVLAFVSGRRGIDHGSLLTTPPFGSCEEIGPERPSEVVAERGYPSADSIHQENPRIESCMVNRRDYRLVRFRRQNCFCNTTIQSSFPAQASDFVQTVISRGGRGFY
jgi:hypothetical protein